MCIRKQGQKLVEEALHRGHNVKAVVRKNNMQFQQVQKFLKRFVRSDIK